MVDLETTGWSPEVAAITEIGLCGCGWPRRRAGARGGASSCGGAGSSRGGEFVRAGEVPPRSNTLNGAPKKKKKKKSTNCCRARRRYRSAVLDARSSPPAAPGWRSCERSRAPTTAGWRPWPQRPQRARRQLLPRGQPRGAPVFEEPGRSGKRRRDEGGTAQRLMMARFASVSSRFADENVCSHELSTPPARRSSTR